MHSRYLTSSCAHQQETLACLCPMVPALPRRLMTRAVRRRFLGVFPRRTVPASKECAWRDLPRSCLHDMSSCRCSERGKRIRGVANDKSLPLSNEVPLVERRMRPRLQLGGAASQATQSRTSNDDGGDSDASSGSISGAVSDSSDVFMSSCRGRGGFAGRGRLARRAGHLRRGAPALAAALSAGKQQPSTGPPRQRAGELRCV